MHLILDAALCITSLENISTYHKEKQLRGFLCDENSIMIYEIKSDPITVRNVVVHIVVIQKKKKNIYDILIALTGSTE